jgi:hypothetical protein
MACHPLSIFSPVATLHIASLAPDAAAPGRLGTPAEANARTPKTRWGPHWPIVTTFLETPAWDEGAKRLGDFLGWHDRGSKLGRFLATISFWRTADVILVAMLTWSLARRIILLP